MRIARDHLALPPVADASDPITLGRLPAGLTVPGVTDRYPGDVTEEPYDPGLCRAATGVD